MAKNMRSTNSKLTKLFLLGCANAAILTAISNQAMAARAVFGEINSEQTVAFLLKNEDPKLASLKKQVKAEIAMQDLKALDNPLQRLVFAYKNEDVSKENKKKVLNSLMANPLSDKQIEHILFKSNIDDLDAKTITTNFDSTEESEILTLVKNNATPLQKRILSNAVENYANGQFVDILINSNNNSTQRQKILNFVDTDTLYSFANAMGEILDQEIDADKTTKLFQDKGLIVQDRKLTEVEVDKLIKNFKTPALKDLASIINDKTVARPAIGREDANRKDIIANKILLGMDVAGYDNVAPIVDPTVPPPPPPPPKNYVAEYKNSTDNNKKNIFEVGEKIKARTPEGLEAKVIDTQISNDAGRVYYALHAGRNIKSNDEKVKIANLERDLRDTVTILLAQEFVASNRALGGKTDQDIAKEFLELFTNGDFATKLKANQILVAALKNNAHIKEIIDKVPNKPNNKKLIDSVFAETNRENIYTVFNSKLNKEHPIAKTPLVNLDTGFLHQELGDIKLAELRKTPGVEFEYKVENEVLLNTSGKVYYSMQAEKSKKSKNDPRGIANKQMGAVNDLSDTIRILLTEEFVYEKYGTGAAAAAHGGRRLTTREQNVIKKAAAEQKQKNITDTLELFTEKNKDNAELREKARFVLDLLRVNPHVQKVIGNNKKFDDDAAIEKFIDGLFIEDAEDAMKRFNYKFDWANPVTNQTVVNVNIPQELKDEIQFRKDKDFKESELKGIKVVSERLEFISKNTKHLDTKDVVGNTTEKKLQQELKSYIDNFDALSVKDKMSLLIDQKTVDHVKGVKPTIQNALNEKLIDWAQNNTVEVLMHSNLTTDLSVDLVKKLAAKADYERVQNYLEEIADAKVQTLKLVELNKGALPKLIADEHITDEIIDLMHNLSPTIFPKGAVELNRAEPEPVGETRFQNRDRLARDAKRQKELTEAKNNIATIFNKTTVNKINPILVEIAKKEVKLPFGQTYTAERVKRIISGLSDKTPRFFSVINNLDVIEKAQTRAVADEPINVNKAKTVLGQKYQEAVESVKDPVAKGIKGTDCLNAEIEAILMAEEVALMPSRYQTINDINRLKDVIKKAIAGEAIATDFIGPVTSEEAKQPKRIKENYSRIITELMKDEVFLKLYSTNDPKSAKIFEGVVEVLYPDTTVGGFFEPIERAIGGTPAVVARVAAAPVAVNPMDDALVGMAEIFDHDRAVINHPVQNRRLARQAERAEIRHRLRDEAENNTSRLVSVKLLFERAEREAEEKEEDAKLAAVQFMFQNAEREEDVANDRVIEGIAGLFEEVEGDEAPAEIEAEVPDEEREEVPEVIEEAPVGGDAREEAPVVDAHDAEGGEAVERPVVPVAAPAGLMPTAGEPRFEDTTESEKEEQEKVEPAAAIEEAKRAEEARIAEAVRVEAEEVAVMRHCPNKCVNFPKVI
ncbi:MAG: Cell surface antigen-like protein Sca8 [Pseudomonadota bacterium]|jgi:hypothetical protein